MIIVSQDRSVIVNFDLIEQIKIVKPLKDIYDKYVIKADTCELAEYDTEERVKEVLQEIVNVYKGYVDNKVYTMPKE